MYLCVLHFRVASDRFEVDWADPYCLIKDTGPREVYVAYNGACSGKVKLAGPKCDLPRGGRIHVAATDEGRGRYTVSLSLDKDDYRSEVVRTTDGRPVRFEPNLYLDAHESWDVVVSQGPIDVGALLAGATTEDGRLYRWDETSPACRDSYRYIDSLSWQAREERCTAEAEFALRLVGKAAAHKPGNVMLSPE